ncbi:MAG: right-handed parallel beta-helix repeat-containing protein [Pirellulales bacterium]|nr:right-handed parallel beta-helix repeat-containing protein [Pirellulales bacterium]
MNAVRCAHLNRVFWLLRVVLSLGLVLVGLVFCADAAPDVLYVATDGSDAWSGTLAQANEDKSDGPFASLARARDEIRRRKKDQTLSKDGATVIVRGGTYELTETLELSAEDAGSESGPIEYRAAPGEEVRISGGRRITGFTPVTDSAILARLDEAARGEVLQADLKAQGVTAFGTAGDGGLRLFFAGEPMTLARWPNEGFVNIVDVMKTDPVDVRGTKGDKVGKFLYDGDRPRRWIGEKDPWLHGYWFWDWSDERQRIESIDPDKRAIAIAPPYHTYGYRKGQWYYALNLLSELDAPGEWYLDRETGVLYFWPPEPIDAAKTAVSVLDRLLVMRDVEHATFRDMTFEAARGAAVTIERGKANRIAQCTLRNLGGLAVAVEGGTDHGVEDCTLYHLARGGIRLAGGDRVSLTPAGHWAVGNEIHDYGQWQRMYAGAISLEGVGQRVENNLIHSAPHTAIFFSGNDHRIERNEIHHVCLESNDAGAIYAGRDWTMRGTVVRHNFLHDITGFRDQGCVGVYLDDMFCGTQIVGNVFCRVTRAAFIGGGRDVLIENNIFVDCDPALHVDARAQGWAADSVDMTMKERLAAVPYAKPPWSKRYPELVGILQDEPAAPKGNVIARNVRVGGRWDGVEDRARRYLTMKDNLIGVDPGFVDAAKMDFRLRPDSPIHAKLPEFEPIPFDQIGLRRKNSAARHWQSQWHSITTASFSCISRLSWFLPFILSLSSVVTSISFCSECDGWA